jgi:hypothetical protein
VNSKTDTTEKCQRWQSEHGPDFEVPQKILDFVARGQMLDTSWHRQRCPQFEIPSPDTHVFVWVDHPDESKRVMPNEEGTRFTVSERGGKILLTTDDVDEVERYLYDHIRKCWGHYAARVEMSEGG